MMINHITCTSKISTDLCFTKQKIKTKNYFKQILVSFKMYADFECNLRGVESYEGFYKKKKKN